MTETPRRGRPPIGDEAAKNRNIRLTDKQWKTFREKLGPDWLRKQITVADLLG